ncbi:MAG TPA: FAD-binding oxidoreductase [Candidatus Saccharimonadales bacterium]|nr:FAD-binding oxidoreductase [Candidatus Saccharimonadales bacterium]
MANLQPAIKQLKNNLDGELALPGDPAYKKASTIFVKKGTPAVVAIPKTAQDITKALAFARDTRLAVSVHNGGHSVAGHSTNDGGLVIDMHRFDDIQVIDKAQQIVRIGAGATWEAVAKALQPHGLGISSGDTKTVGVAGLTLAGGVGWMVRRDGLALDNLVAAELVMADGQLLRVTSTEHPDLFWAIRGGGGNFGVATNFEFKAQPVDHVFAGMVMYDMKDLQKALRGWRDYMRTAPEELTTMFLVMPANPAFAGMPTSVMILLCHAGGKETDVMKTIKPLLHLGTVLKKDITRKHYADVLEEVHPPKDMKVITNNAFIQTLNDEVVDTICAAKDQMLQIRSLGGAMNRVPQGATAFAHRDNEVLIVAPTFVAPDASEATITKALTPWRNIQAFSNGTYCSFSSQDTDETIAAAYPKDTYAKLARIKKQYDPKNLFDHNYNIKPL